MSYLSPLFFFFFFTYTATTEIYTTDTLFPYTTLFRSCAPTRSCASGTSTRHACGTGQRRSEEHTSELQSLMRNSYAVLCLKKKKHHDDGIVPNGTGQHDKRA